MPKRKRKDDHNITTSPHPHPPIPPSELLSCSSRMASLTKEKSSRKVDNNTVKSLASIIDITDCPEKQSGSHQSDQNLNHTILLRHPRYYMGRQYVRRNSSKTAGTSTSHGKVTPSQAVEMRFPDSNKSSGKDGGQYAGGDQELEFCRAKRARSSSLSAAVNTAASPSSSRDAAKMACGICERLLKRKPYITLDNAISTGDISVVAVLVCGHVYHADCLEQGTSDENRHDPPCPMCSGLLQQTAVDGLD
ncbi:uncharacterized protein LOC124912587 isoform X2 [Impatiens glandulifera]|uniref:uncharacterized protein LOC124912587 isoform X2 n=1 Tax=Impatiens glandulifera TaxID=253017 RepID=UPI001FB0AFB3|nr:uncharacterized protein LOC124912587 isoform X2 [Impatiens glandulifera]